LRGRVREGVRKRIATRPLAASAIDSFDHGSEAGVQIGCRDPEGFDVVRQENLVAPSVPGCSFRQSMEIAVDLDREQRLLDIEIDDIGTDRMLPAAMETDPMSPEHFP
jgi:hypothetical protein